MVKLDKIILSSLHAAFRNREKLVASVTLSGSIPDGGANFSTTLATSRNSSVTEIYYKRRDAYPSRKADSGVILFDATWDHSVYLRTEYIGANQLRIVITLDNPSGAAKTITTQTYDFTIYVFDTPFST